jgi:hypothetical protein
MQARVKFRLSRPRLRSGYAFVLIFNRSENYAFYSTTELYMIKYLHIDLER